MGLIEKLITPGHDIDFMGLRRYFLGASFLLMAISAIAMVEPGPKFGTDFQGGTEVELQFKKPVEAGALRDIVAGLGFESIDVVAVGGEAAKHRFLIRVKEVSSLSEDQRAAVEKSLCLIPEEGELKDPNCPEALRTEEVKVSPGGDKITARYLANPCGPAEGQLSCPPREDIAKQLVGRVASVELRSGAGNPLVQNPRDHKVEFRLKSRGDQIMDGLRAKLGADVAPEEPLRIEWIGPKAGKQLRDAAISSMSIAIVFIMVYIAFRFDLRFAPGAIVALIHDVILAMGAMVLAQREVTLSTVAALLTIVGYSINDTVVVYDRIRENLGKHRKMTFPKIINRSVTEMLGRTIRTSSLTAVAVIPFLFWGTTVIQDFAFALLVGVVVGTYSSIYIAAPLTEYIDRKFFGSSVKKKRRVQRKARRDRHADEIPTESPV